MMLNGASGGKRVTWVFRKLRRLKMDFAQISPLVYHAAAS